jgi:hypothetical protein
MNYPYAGESVSKPGHMGVGLLLLSLLYDQLQSETLRPVYLISWTWMLRV